jgi:hypothetical protein
MHEKGPGKTGAFDITALARKNLNRRVGKANEARECAPDGVPTKTLRHGVSLVLRWARREERLLPTLVLA